MTERRRAQLYAYVYPGFHPIPERDASFHPGFTEWELVRECRPRFDGHAQPKVPLWGEYDDRDPVEVGRRVRLAREHGIDGFVYGLFWCRGKRVFEDALDLGYLGSPEGRETPFAVMWANRMPRRVLPVRRADAPVIDEARRVSSDVDDFVRLAEVLATRYFQLPSYLRRAGKPYFSIFDSTYFIKELGPEDAAAAVREARARVRALGLPGIHLAAIEPSDEALPLVREVGFDEVTHYVLLPHWKGPFQQDYAELSIERAGQWSSFAERSGLPYVPSVATGWDASPRGADFGPRRPDKYPWSPVVVGESPQAFEVALRRAVAHAEGTLEDPWVFLASWNEWSEGHFLEPCERFGMGALEAVRRVAARR